MQRWLAVSPGIECKGDVGKLRLAVFRKNAGGRAFPMLVTTKELQLDDLMYVEAGDRLAYCRLSDFHRDAKGAICYWAFEDAGIPAELQTAMLAMRDDVVDHDVASRPNATETIFVSFRQNNQGKPRNA